MKLAKYSMGTGDRFGREHEAQLRAVIAGNKRETDFAVVWNKSYREHKIIGTLPERVREAADAAVAALNWEGQYYVDADHINMDTVDLFMESCDFFTLDVAAFTGETAAPGDIRTFIDSCSFFIGELSIPGIEKSLTVTENSLKAVAEKYLLAVQEAGKIYRRIESAKGRGNFVAEVSMDETDDPQSPEELFFILKAIADEGIPAQTIAPKFTGRFNKGVDYVGDLEKFDREFREDLCVISKAVEIFDLPENLKLSVHSGSDKFAIYPIIKKHIESMDAGIHVKTAGTTWLEEIIGLAESGGKGLEMARDIYRKAFGRYDELAAPYAEVIDIDTDRLPSPEEVESWSADRFASVLRHDQSNPAYNLHFRQLLHLAYKIAAEMGEEFFKALEEHRETVEKNVTENILERHLKRLYPEE